MPIFMKPLCHIAAGSLIFCLSCAQAQVTQPSGAATSNAATGNAANNSYGNGTAVFNPTTAGVRTNSENVNEDAATSSSRASTLPEPMGKPGINNDRDIPIAPANTPAKVAELTFSDPDTDGSGEFTQAERDEHQIFFEAQFNAMDTNHNGSIDQFEFEDFQDRKETQLED